jgi:uncharacterized cupredoxin-like copper-binding protein
MLLKYGGISFISGAVNHGFFSSERSLWTAAAGIVMFVLGAWWEHRVQEHKPGEGMLATLAWGTVLSIGLGFFTGGLQHFPDSPARSVWVVPLGFVVSAIALIAQSGRWPARASLAATSGLALVVGTGSIVAWQLLPPAGALAHDDHGPDAPVDRTVVVRMSDQMRFEPAVVRVRRGETVRFVASNEGRLPHELVLGSAAQLREHAAAMNAGQSHVHGAARGVSVPPGRSGEFVASFDRDEVLEMACLEPGHYEAGMRGRVDVAASDPVPQAPRHEHHHN